MKRHLIQLLIIFGVLVGQFFVGKPTLGRAAGRETGVVVLLGRFANTHSTSMTKAQVDEMVFGESGSLKAFIEENSYGWETLFGQVEGWFTLPKPTREQCLKHDDEFEDEVVRQLVKLADDDVDFSRYRHLIVIFPATPCLDGTGGGEKIRIESGDYDGSKSFNLVTINGRLNLYTLAHEFGHNLGLGHAYAFECGEVSTVAPLNLMLQECQRWEYEDHFTVMGTQPMHHNAFYKEKLEWFDEDHQLLEVTESGTHMITIQPLSSQGNGIKAVKILKEDGPNEIQPLGPIYYYLEFRQPIGFDAILPSHHPTYRGLLIHQGGPKYSVNESELLDMTPNSHPHYTDLLIKNDFLGARDFFDAALAVGEVYYDEYNGIEIEPLEITDEGIVVEIDIP